MPSRNSGRRARPNSLQQYFLLPAPRVGRACVNTLKVLGNMREAALLFPAFLTNLPANVRFAGWRPVCSDFVHHHPFSRFLDILAFSEMLRHCRDLRPHGPENPRRRPRISVSVAGLRRQSPLSKFILRDHLQTVRQETGSHGYGRRVRF